MNGSEWEESGRGPPLPPFSVCLLLPLPAWPRTSSTSFLLLHVSSPHHDHHPHLSQLTLLSSLLPETTTQCCGWKLPTECPYTCLVAVPEQLLILGPLNYLVCSMLQTQHLLTQYWAGQATAISSDLMRSLLGISVEHLCEAVEVCRAQSSFAENHACVLKNGPSTCGLGLSPGLAEPLG